MADEETLHTLRMLELTGHANIPWPGAPVFPLIRTQEETRLASALDGKVEWLGAWAKASPWSRSRRNPGPPVKSNAHSPYEIPPMPEGQPASSPSTKTLPTSSSARCALILIRSPSMPPVADQHRSRHLH